MAVQQDRRHCLDISDWGIEAYVGDTGAGKTFSSAYHGLNILNNVRNITAIFVDPLGAYEPLTNAPKTIDGSALAYLPESVTPEERNTALNVALQDDDHPLVPPSDADLYHIPPNAFTPDRRGSEDTLSKKLASILQTTVEFTQVVEGGLVVFIDHADALWEHLNTQTDDLHNTLVNINEGKLNNNQIGIRLVLNDQVALTSPTGKAFWDRIHFHRTGNIPEEVISEYNIPCGYQEKIRTANVGIGNDSSETLIWTQTGWGQTEIAPTDEELSWLTH